GVEGVEGVEGVKGEEGVGGVEAQNQFLIPVQLVNDRASALRAIAVLRANPQRVWACDTEVADIDVKKEGPVGNGKVICVSIYGGEGVDFSGGGGKSTLWIDNDGKAAGVLDYFKEWFEDEAAHKVWHNYGFDRHVLFNEGINCMGFAGDTMHMARLHDTGRDKMSGGGGGYSLQALSNDLYKSDPRFAKTSMKELFGVGKLKKDGTESKIKELPCMRVLQNDPLKRDMWIEYSARDAVATWWVWDKLRSKLKQMAWQVNGVKLPDQDGEKPNMYHFYQRYLRAFGELLTDMERNGIKVDTKVHLKQAEMAARAERARLEDTFTSWARDFCPDIGTMNIASATQMCQLLFGEYSEWQLISKDRVFKVEKTDEEVQAETEEVLRQNPYAAHAAPDLKAVLKGRGLKVSGKKEEQVYRLLEYDAKKAELLALGRQAVEELCTMRGLECSGDAAQLAEEFLRSEAAGAGRTA
ncbi:ribonuclease H-like domain-containing protein, partial [Ochromonadaceae sp. CCMP2298]